MNYYLNAFNEMLRKRQMQNQMGRGGGQMMDNGGGGNERMTSPFDAMSNAQKAGYYSDNPRMAAITQGLQKGFGSTSYGMLQNAMYPDFVAEQGMVGRGIDPGTGLQVGGYGSRQAPDLQSFDIATPTPTGLYGDQFASETAPQSRGFFESFLNSVLPSSNVTLNPVPVEDRAPTPVGFSSPTSNFGKESSIPTEGIVSPGMDSSVSSGNDFGSFSSSFDSGGYEGGGYYNQGGMVKAQHLMGRAPAPDDGYGALQDGEYVITKAAVERYGKAMMDAINNGTFR